MLASVQCPVGMHLRPTMLQPTGFTNKLTTPRYIMAGFKTQKISPLSLSIHYFQHFLHLKQNHLNWPLHPKHRIAMIPIPMMLMVSSTRFLIHVLASWSCLYFKGKNEIGLRDNIRNLFFSWKLELQGFDSQLDFIKNLIFW